MATTDNKIINGSGLSELSSQIKSYVNDKTEISVGATAPTDNKIKLWVDTSATGEVAWNDITGKPDLATKSEVQQVEDKIPAPYTLPKATTSTLGGVMPDGNTITITDGVISAVGSGGGEPDAYIKDASISGNTLTLTKKDNTEVVFTPSGGSSGGSGSEWIYTTDETESGLYNAKELVIFYLQTATMKLFCEHFIFVKQDGTQGTLGADFSNQYFGMFYRPDTCLWNYNGSQLGVYNLSYKWLAFAYKI